MPKKKGFYASEPAVPASKIAGVNPIQGPVVGSMESPTVDQHPGAIHGLGTPTRPFGHPSVHGAHGYGHVGKERHGHLRTSGHAGAHQLGIVKKKPKL